MTESKELCPKCGSAVFGILRDMTSRRVCKCNHTWDAPEKKYISPHLLVHKELWNQVSERYDKLKSDYDALKAKLEKAELEVKFVKEYLNPADTSFKQMIDAFRVLPKEKQDKLINLSQSLVDLENT